MGTNHNSKSKKDGAKESKESALSDVIKKVVSVGVGAAFMTEDAVKNILQDLPLPKDIITGLLSNAKSAKEDFRDSIIQEIKGQFSKVDTSKLLEETLDNYDIEVHTTLKFKKKSDKKS